MKSKEKENTCTTCGKCMKYNTSERGVRISRVSQVIIQSRDETCVTFLYANLNRTGIESRS